MAKLLYKIITFSRIKILLSYATEETAINEADRHIRIQSERNMARAHEVSQDQLLDN